MVQRPLVIPHVARFDTKSDAFAYARKMQQHGYACRVYLRYRDTQPEAWASSGVLPPARKIEGYFVEVQRSVDEGVFD